MFIINKLKAKLSHRQKASIHKLLSHFSFIYSVRRYFALGGKLKPDLSPGKELKFHLGCNNVKLPGFINVDIRNTIAADMVMDLTVLRLPENRAKCLYSNAFFEHLYRNTRTAHLKSAYSCLAPDGFICYTGLPYFKNIAKLYLEKGPGSVSPVFDLYNVYRYTHGDPEQAPDWYMEQLHKSLFDEEELETLLKEVGFVNYIMFSYAHPSDANPVPINIGFYATKTAATSDELNRKTVEFLNQFEGSYILLSTLNFIPSSKQ